MIRVVCAWRLATKPPRGAKCCLTPDRNVPEARKQHQIRRSLETQQKEREKEKQLKTTHSAQNTDLAVVGRSKPQRAAGRQAPKPSSNFLGMCKRQPPILLHLFSSRIRFWAQTSGRASAIYILRAKSQFVQRRAQTTIAICNGAQTHQPSDCRPQPLATTTDAPISRASHQLTRASPSQLRFRENRMLNRPSFRSFCASLIADNPSLSAIGTASHPDRFS